MTETSSVAYNEIKSSRNEVLYVFFVCQPFFQEVDDAARGRSGYKAGRHSSIWCRNKEKHLLYKQKEEMILYFNKVKIFLLCRLYAEIY